MFRQDFDRVYKMVNPLERNIIIHMIEHGELVSETATGQSQNWWKDKHHPNKEIPRNIYLIADGRIPSIYDEYVRLYGPIEWSEFINYTREMIKQGIMY